MADRILNKALKAKVMSAEAAAALIPNGAVIGMSGFTGAGYPKAVPIALAKRALDEKLKGKALKFDVLTGASTGPEQDTMMSMVEASRFRFPYPLQRAGTGTGKFYVCAGCRRPFLPSFLPSFLGSAPAELPSSRPLNPNADARSGGQGWSAHRS